MRISTYCLIMPLVSGVLDERVWDASIEMESRALWVLFAGVIKTYLTEIIYSHIAGKC